MTFILVNFRIILEVMISELLGIEVEFRVKYHVSIFH
jgi:hypothetical protein